MRNIGLLIAALAALAAGTIGMVALVAPPAGSSATDAFSSAGQRIYYLGVDAQGVPIPRTSAGAGMMGFGMMGTIGCVDCHGEDGRGGRVGMIGGPVEIADIRYTVLTAPRSEDGTMQPGWSDDDIARAVRDGVKPNGKRLMAPMPRWDMTDSEVNDVISYLKELSAR